MRDDLAAQFYPALLHGLTLRDRVARGDRPNLAAEQAAAKGFLGSANQPPPWANGEDPTRSVALGDGPRGFLGIRYVLTCWLDEALIDAGWREWDENKLESVLYRTNIRYDNFWDQAGLAEATPGAGDAQEAFLLSVLLGFRGRLGETPDRLREWVQATRSRVSRSLGKELPAVPEQTPESNVPLLTGVDAYQRMTKRLLVVFLAAVPIVAFLIVYLFS